MHGTILRPVLVKLIAGKNSHIGGIRGKLGTTAGATLSLTSQQSQNRIGIVFNLFIAATFCPACLLVLYLPLARLVIQ